MTGGAKWLRRLVHIEPGEARAIAWAFVYHFSLLSSYYILRPIRDEMGIAGGIGNLQWLFLGTFAVMMAIVPAFGWLTSRVPRERFLPYAYAFFIANILVFFVLFRSTVAHAQVARAFFIWLSVFNLFVVSIFWSFMTDLFDDATSHGRHHDALGKLLKTEPFDFVQLSYSIVNRDVEKTLLPLARDRGVATLINRPFQRGALFRAVKGKPLPAWAKNMDCVSWAQFFLKFIASHPAVTCMIPATSKPKHMRDNMGAGYGRLPDDKLRKKMAAYIASL